MGDFNPTSVLIQGSELRPPWHWSAGPFTRNNVGVLQRFRPTGAVTLTHVHTFLRPVVGNPGLGIEILNTDAPPTLTEEDHFPGTDTGATKSAWQTLAAATSTFAAIDDDFDDTDGLRNISAVSGTGSIELLFRGNDTALTSKRIDRFQIWVRVKFVAASGNGRNVRISGRVNIGGTSYTYGSPTSVPSDGLTRYVKVADWRLNPSTGLPWTQAEINAIVSTTATDEFGFVADKAAIGAGANGLQLYGMKTVVTTAAENRMGFLYSSSVPRSGWSRNTLGSTAALTANTYYWLHLFALRGSRIDSFDLNVIDNNMGAQRLLIDPTVTGEHRIVQWADLTGPSGIILNNIVGNWLGQIPYLLESSGPTIHSQSQPYTAIDYVLFDTSTTANTGTEITSASGTNTYAGVELPVYWTDRNLAPHKPLTIEIRHGVGALTGGGTLLATATLDPHRNYQYPGIDPRGRNVFIPFDGGNATPPAATQLFALVKSSSWVNNAEQWRGGWTVPRLDTRSDLLSTGGGTTAANIQGASVGGTTDSFSAGGTENDRYDLPIALKAPPVAPASPTATVTAAA